MDIPEEELQRLLREFDGKKVNLAVESGNKAFSLGFFTGHVDPCIHADIPIDVTWIEQNYSTYYRKKQDGFSTFNMFILFNLMKTIEQNPFFYLCYRYMNGEWYCFNNLPLMVSVKVDDPAVQQVFFFVKNIREMDWKTFYKTYSEGVAICRANNSNVQLADSNNKNLDAGRYGWHAMGHLMTSMLFDFDSYTPSQKPKELEAHAPWFIFSKRSQEEEKTFITLSCHVSHASFIPAELDKFVKAFQKNASAVPENQQITRYFKK